MPEPDAPEPDTPEPDTPEPDTPEADTPEQTPRESGPHGDAEAGEPPSDAKTAGPPDGPGGKGAGGESQPVPVVGIGYSAGGLEALTALLDDLDPATGMAIVVAQHINTGGGSQLTDVLQRHTRMPVRVGRDGTVVEADHLYVAPQGQRLRYEAGVLRSLERDRSGPHQEIDTLLTSLAEGLGPRCMGIVLSGTMRDGVEGMGAVKAAGGFTLVQSLDTARFQQLPAAVMEAHAMDLVLPPSELAAEINRIGPRLVRGEEGLDEQPDDGRPALERIVNTLLRHTGVDFRQYKRSTLRRRIDRRVVAKRSEDLETYARMLASDETEVKALFNDLLINVTGFFRDPDFYAILEEKVVQPLVAGRTKGESIRVWVPGCASGEEVYSLGILFLEAMEKAERRVDVQIFGTDLSESAVRGAREGSYVETAMEPVSDERRKRFFHASGSGMRVNKRLRDLCLFAVHDMTRDPPFSNIDLLSCRNVLIYMDRGLQRRVLATFHYALRPDGTLALGPSEATGEAQELFSPTEDTALYRRRAVTTQPLAAAHHPAWEGRTEVDPQISPGSGQMVRDSKDIIAKRYGVTALAITRSGRTAWAQGDVAAFMVAGEPRVTGDAVRPDLRPEIVHAVEKVHQTGEATHCTVRGEDQTFDVEVLPVGGAGGEDPGCLLMTEAGRAKPGFRPRRNILQRVAQSFRPRKVSEREELASLRGYLQHVIEDYEATTEELRSANEEALASNEELQSTNEELETAREELQSTNEELATLNEEMHVRNAEMHAVRDELSSLIDSLALPIVAVGEDLAIRRFTAQARDALNLIDTDVGRPLTDINTGLDGPWLAGHVRRVVESMQVERQQVTAHDGVAYELVVSPLRTEGDRVEGAVLILMPSGA